jgi:hypothetical protein
MGPLAPRRRRGRPAPHSRAPRRPSPLHPHPSPQHPHRLPNQPNPPLFSFTSEGREAMPDNKSTPVVCISTFTMISHSGKRSEAGEAMMRAIREREWGLLLLDEVHVVPAAMFRKVRAGRRVGGGGQGRGGCCCWARCTSCRRQCPARCGRAGEWVLGWGAGLHAGRGGGGGGRCQPASEKRWTGDGVYLTASPEPARLNLLPPRPSPRPRRSSASSRPTASWA